MAAPSAIDSAFLGNIQDARLSAPIQRHSLRSLTVKDLGRLACACKSTRQLVEGADLQVWRAAAAEALPPRLALPSSDRKAIQQLLNRCHTASSNIRQAKEGVTLSFPDHAYLGRFESVEFSPDGDSVLHRHQKGFALYQSQLGSWSEVAYPEGSYVGTAGWLFDGRVRAVYVAPAHNDPCRAKSVTYEASRGALLQIASNEVVIPKWRSVWQIFLAPGSQFLTALGTEMKGLAQHSLAARSQRARYVVLDVKSGECLASMDTSPQWNDKGTHAVCKVDSGFKWHRVSPPYDEDVMPLGKIFHLAWHGSRMVCRMENDFFSRIPDRYEWKVCDHSTRDLITITAPHASSGPIISGDGKMLAICVSGSGLGWKLYHFSESRPLVCALQSHLGLRNLQWPPSGKLVAAITWDGKLVQVHDVETGRLLCTLDKMGFVEGVSWSPHGCSLSVRRAGHVDLVDFSARTASQ